MPENEKNSLIDQIHQAFEKKPDNANILQGVRKLRKGKPSARVVLFPSVKNGGFFIPCEGRLEAGMALSLELDPTVDSYRGQPIAIDGPNGRRVVPDFVVRRTDSFFDVIDVKPFGQLQRPSVKDRMRHVREAFSRVGINHHIVTENELTHPPAEEVRKCLRLGLNAELNKFEQEKLLVALSRGSFNLKLARAEAQALKLSPYAIELLAIRGHLIIPTNSTWKETTQIGVQHETNKTTATGRSTIHDLCVAI